jgi:hypothetical protein
MSINDELSAYVRGETASHKEGLSLSRGLVAGMQPVYKFGKSTTVGATSFSTIWKAGGLYETPTTATVATIVSDSANDTAVGTGARTIQIEGLDEDFNFQSEVVTLDGTSSVNSTLTYIRLNRMFVLTAGSLSNAAGLITCTVDSKLVCRIDDNDNQSQVAHYTIPANKTGYLDQLSFGVGSGKEVEMRIAIRRPGGVYRSVSNFFLYQNTENITLSMPVSIPEKSDIQIQAIAASGTVAVNATFLILLVDNE